MFLKKQITMNDVVHQSFQYKEYIDEAQKYFEENSEVTLIDFLQVLLIFFKYCARFVFITIKNIN